MNPQKIYEKNALSEAWKDGRQAEEIGIPNHAIKSMIEFAELMCEKQRRICSDQIRTRFDIFENLDAIKNAPEPEELR